MGRYDLKWHEWYGDHRALGLTRNKDEKLVQRKFVVSQGKGSGKWSVSVNGRQGNVQLEYLDEAKKYCQNIFDNIRKEERAL